MQAAKGELLKMGFKEEQVATKLRARRISKVMDIIQEGAGVADMMPWSWAEGGYPGWSRPMMKA